MLRQISTKVFGAPRQVFFIINQNVMGGSAQSMRNPLLQKLWLIDVSGHRVQEGNLYLFRTHAPNLIAAGRCFKHGT